MESLLRFKETSANLDDTQKLVPWLNWDEWDFVRVSLFSSSPDSVSKALHRIAAWRSRGCLPVVIEVTASFIETQQKDPHFGAAFTAGVSDSEEMLSMLYTMAVMRLVNGLIEKTRKKREISIAEAAAGIDMPRFLIDVRHEGSHRDLPSLRLLRLASVEALKWLKSYYWIPQKNAIPYQNGKTGNVRKEIRSRLRELALILKAKQHLGSSSSAVKEKRMSGAKHHEQHHGRNKFFSLLLSKSKSSKYIGSRKQLTRTLKNLSRLYSFFSSDVVSVVLEILLKAPNSMDTMNSSDNFQINVGLDTFQALFDEWKPSITKFTKKEPELLLGLLKAVLDVNESRRSIRDHFGGEHFSLLQYDVETERIGILSSLFTQLVLVLKNLKSRHDEVQGIERGVDYTLLQPTLIELMKRCLYASDLENSDLLRSAFLLGEMAGSSCLNQKLHKLSLLTSLHSKLADDNLSDAKAEDLNNQHLHQAAQKLELLKLRRRSNAISQRSEDDNLGDSNIWTVAKSWNPCPIGMLPRAVGSSGCLPVLDRDLCEMASYSNEVKCPELRHCNQREANLDMELMNNSSVKRMAGTENLDVSESEDVNAYFSLDGLEGRLLICGVWQLVGEQELEDMKSKVGILVTRRHSLSV